MYQSFICFSLDPIGHIDTALASVANGRLKLRMLVRPIIIIIITAVDMTAWSLKVFRFPLSQVARETDTDSKFISMSAGTRNKMTIIKLLMRLTCIWQNYSKTVRSRPCLRAIQRPVTVYKRVYMHTTMMPWGLIDFSETSEPTSIAFVVMI